MTKQYTLSFDKAYDLLQEMYRIETSHAMPAMVDHKHMQWDIQAIMRCDIYLRNDGTINYCHGNDFLWTVAMQTINS